MPPLELLLIATFVFVLAGFSKGVVGMGLPTIAMGALGLVMPPVQAAALLVLPSLVTNVWQFVVGPSPKPIIKRLALMMVLVCIGTAIGIQFLTSGNSHWPSFALGLVLAAYAVIGLFLLKLSVPARHESWLGPIIGGITGLLTGATGVFVVPAVPYLSALGLSKDELVQALGLSFTVSTIALAVGLAFKNSFSPNLVIASAAAIVPALVGMLLGQRLRDRLDQAAFRRWFFVAMLLVGCYMAIRALLSFNR
jgi:uncharacterized protein